MRRPQQVIGELQRLKRTIELQALVDVTHYQMGAYIDPLRAAGRWVEQQRARVSRAHPAPADQG